MKVTPTPSRDGIERVTIRVEHRLTRDEMVNVLLDSLDYAPELSELSGPAVLDAIRKELRYSGEIEFDHDEPTYEARAWAERMIEKVWPT